MSAGHTQKAQKVMMQMAPLSDLQPNVAKMQNAFKMHFAALQSAGSANSAMHFAARPIAARPEPLPDSARFVFSLLDTGENIP